MTQPARLAAAVSLLVAFIAPLPASAQTWVSGASGVTDQANCARSVPCRTFAYAASRLPNGGEIIVLDSADYGPVTLSANISIVAEGSEGGIAVDGNTTAITVNGSGIGVLLRGLTFEGAGGNSMGINVINAASVTVENCHFRDLYVPIYMQSSSPAQLAVLDSSFFNDTYGVIFAHNASGRESATFTRVFIDQTSNGIYAYTQAAGELQIQVTDSVVSNSTAGVFAGSDSGNALLCVLVSDTHLVDNAYGLYVAGSQACGIMDHVTIQGSTTQALYRTGGAAIFSYGNNPINDNAAFGDSPIVIGQH